MTSGVVVVVPVLKNAKYRFAGELMGTFELLSRGWVLSSVPSSRLLLKSGG